MGTSRQTSRTRKASCRMSSDEKAENLEEIDGLKKFEHETMRVQRKVDRIVTRE